MRPQTPVDARVAITGGNPTPVPRWVPSTTPNPGSLGSPAQSDPPMDPPFISDEDMAWSLVDAVKPCLTDYERTVAFVELGCGEGYLVIKHILTALLSTPATLPLAILAKLSGWLNGYAGCPEEPHMRMMLALICLQRCEVRETA
ncbi:hypothetical protein [Mycobacterium sp. E2327]|uniref:hypothetical protein n=1 Tax=Mycobacterium sp. E2327 TaxID=1834132 RepID=UPI000A624073|nr:hypothetical protein [Mycobacterium sp. E2327]